MTEYRCGQPVVGFAVLGAVALIVLAVVAFLVYQLGGF